MADKDVKRVSWDGAVIVAGSPEATEDNVGFPTGYKEDASGKWNVIVTSVKDGDKSVPLIYAVPHFDSFLEYVTSLPKTLAEGQTGVSLETIWERYVYAEDLKRRAAQRESVAAESTVVMVNGKPLDLLKMEPVRACAAVNAAYMWASTTGKDVAKAAQVARRKMLENGIDGKEVREDEKSKMLQLSGKASTKK